MGCFIVVTGLPASGKTTVAQAVAQSLRLPMLDKDDFLESLFEGAIVGSAQRRRELSHAADQEFCRRAEQSKGAVLASWWKHPRSLVDSGTPAGWLASLPGPCVEVHCRCGPVVAAERFAARKRHPGHLDGRWSHAELLTSFAQQTALGPLGIGNVITVDTERDFELGTLVRNITRAFGNAAVDGPGT